MKLSTIMNSAAIPEGEKVPEIQSLTLRAQTLGQSVDRWNTAMLWALGLAAIAAFAVVLTTRIVLTKAKQLAKVQDELIRAKDKQLAIDLREKDLKIADAGERAAQANLVAEGEKLARVKIEKQLAPRFINEPDRIKIAGDLRKFAPSYSARKIQISSLVGDAEGIVFSLEILDIITRAGIAVDPIIGRVEQIGPIDLGVKVTGPSADEAFIRALLTHIRADCDTSLNGEWGPQYKEISIAVGVRPVAGLPTLIQAARK